MAHLDLTRATASDLGYVMATERRDGYDAVVGRWDEQKHLSALGDGRHAYFLGLRGGVPVGFVPEGVARGSAFFGGVHRDEMVMAILRSDDAKASVQSR